jgi:hypothetical protein
MLLMEGVEIRCAINRNLHGEPEYDRRLLANKRLLKKSRGPRTTVTDLRVELFGETTD